MNLHHLLFFTFKKEKLFPPKEAFSIRKDGLHTNTIALVSAVSTLGMAEPPEGTEYSSLPTGGVVGRHGSCRVGCQP